MFAMLFGAILGGLMFILKSFFSELLFTDPIKIKAIEDCMAIYSICLCAEITVPVIDSTFR